jgi:hypothetical protein
MQIISPVDQELKGSGLHHRRTATDGRHADTSGAPSGASMLHNRMRLASTSSSVSPSTTLCRGWICRVQPLTKLARSRSQPAPTRPGPPLSSRTAAVMAADIGPILPVVASHVDRLRPPGVRADIAVARAVLRTQWGDPRVDCSGSATVGAFGMVRATAAGAVRSPRGGVQALSAGSSCSGEPELYAGLGLTTATSGAIGSTLIGAWLAGPAVGSTAPASGATATASALPMHSV